MGFFTLFVGFGAGFCSAVFGRSEIISQLDRIDKNGRLRNILQKELELIKKYMDKKNPLN